MISYTTFSHPLIGTLLLVTNEQRLIRSSYTDFKLVPEIEEGWKRNPRHPILEEAVSQLREYLSAKRKKLTVPLEIQGSAFQQQVYGLVLKIPLGEVANYSELACELKKPRAARSVGAAIGKNPLLIFIPDHRVTNSSGSTGGFAGEWNRKPGLLKLEAEMAGNSAKID